MSKPAFFFSLTPDPGVAADASIAPHLGSAWQCLCPGHRLHGVTGAPEDLRAELARDGYREQPSAPTHTWTANTSVIVDPVAKTVTPV